MNDKEFDISKLNFNFVPGDCVYRGSVCPEIRTTPPGIVISVDEAQFTVNVMWTGKDGEVRFGTYANYELCHVPDVK